VFGSGQFEFIDARDVTVRVVYQNIVAEFIFANFSPTKGRLVPVEYIPAGTELEEGEVGLDLFNIWVVQASENAYISIAEVPDLDPEDPGPRLMDPFGGNVTLRVVPGDEGLEAAPFGAGSVLLGTRTPEDDEVENSDDFPVTRMKFTSGYGIVGPTPTGWLSSGLVVEPGQDLQRFLLGGTVIGEVSIGGSMELFYAGAVLTGTANGQGLGPTGIPQNFRVRGDLRNLIVMAELGANQVPETIEDWLSPEYTVGLDLVVGGTVGQIRTLTDGADYIGSVHVQNSATAPHLRGTTFEWEVRHTDDFEPGPDFQSGNLGDLNEAFNNDTFDTAQYLPIYNHSRLGPGSVQVRGQVQNVPLVEDEADYYAVGLMAGQTVTVRLVANEQATVGVFDPDQRLIATDQNNIEGIGGQTSTLNQAFRFTADRPGIYRFAVALTQDPDFGGSEFTPPTLYTAPYLLQIVGAGNVALGGLAIGGDWLAPGASGSVLVDAGDAGALVAAETIYSRVSAPTATVLRGNLRAIVADTLGSDQGPTGQIADGPSIDVPTGSVGLIRTTGLADFNRNSIDPIGGDYQMVDVGGTLVTSMIANGSIGTVRAGDMVFPNYQNLFEVDANQDGVGGVLDLMDVTGDLGTLGGGGPAIINNGGNVRYMRVGGDVYRDQFFGGGQPEPTVYEPGETASFIDDSGVSVKLEPIPLTRTINFETGQVTLVNPGTLTVTTYGVRARRFQRGGGVVIMNVDSTRGLSFRADAARSGSAEITTVNAGLDAALPDVQIIVNGKARLDVLEIIGTDFTEIANGTSGELAVVVADNITRLAGRSLGLASSHTPSIVELRAADVPTNAAAPLAATNTGIFVDEELTLAEARQGIGNVEADTIGTLTANSDRVFESKVYEGINGRIFTSADMGTINIGEGILPTGTGEVFYSGLFATGFIDEVTNQGLGSDIMGDIVSLTAAVDDVLLGTRSSIGSISLRDGSIINADILGVTEFAQAREFVGSHVATQGAGTLTNPLFEIGTIKLTGVGGIIGAFILAADVGDVVVTGGFGIMSSLLVVDGGGLFHNIVGDGYGVRYTQIFGGQRLNELSAPGRGNTIPSTYFSPTVRWSETQRYDPYFGTRINVLTDLHAVLGTSASTPTRPGITEAGQLANVDLRMGRDVNLVSADQIKSSFFTSANSINRMLIRKTINDLQLTTGRLNRLITDVDLLNSSVIVAGPIGTIKIGRTFDDFTTVRATGPEGKVFSFSTGLDFRGILTSTGRISTINVGRHIKGQARVIFEIDNVDARSKVGLLLVNGSIFAPVVLDIDDGIEKLLLGGDLKEGATIKTRSIGEQVIKGQVFGDIIIG
jgi:hypothetical protein